MFLKKIHKGIRIRCAIGLLLVLMTFQLCEEELFPGTDKKYQTMVYDVESGNFWLGKDCDHLYSYGKCAIENYRADTDLLAYVEGKWEVPEYQTFYDYLCSMDWLKTS
ncbi:hypothetical protein SAMN04487928_15011 [Butyrivibrio proteoclasticus]|uniref:Uncharacterized protein n=2 Tax=Butyrivibrio proteoclasticus TaxID=43305 RepID=A0A1I5YMM1_9FIRM|nr:hypothetical protein SAMN04487928_15011 [Butyrivibrio proteoclasticus]